MLTLNQFGVEPKYKITLFDGVQTKIFNQDEIIDVSGLEAVVKNAGAAGTSSFSATIADPGRTNYSLISASFLFRDITVTREFYDHTGLLLDSTEAFKGLLNPPLPWNEESGSLTLNGLSKTEGAPIGYSINRDDDPQLIYEELHGKAWPLAFGTVKQQPTLKFLIGEDGTLNPIGTEELRTGSATVANLNLGNLTRTDLETYAELIKETKIKGFDPANLGLWKRGGLLYPVPSHPEAYLLFNTRKRVLTTMPDGTPIDIERQPNTKFNRFEEAFEARIKLSDYESIFYKKTGTEQSKINFKEAVINWCNKYLEYFTLTTVQKLDYNVANNVLGNLKNLEALAEKYANIESPYEAALVAALGTSDLLGDIQDLYVTNNTLEQRTSGPYQINLNGARFTCTNNESKLLITGILPAAENIAITPTDDLRVNAFKSTDNCDLTNMYCLVGNKVIYITGSVVARDINGDFESVTYTFDNLYYDTFVKQYVPIVSDDYEYFGHYIESKVIDSTQIDEASVTILPTWNLDNNVGNDGTIKYLDEKLKPVPSEGLYTATDPVTLVDVRSHLYLTEDAWEVNAGDEVLPWNGCPTFDEDSNSQSGTQFYAARKYICNLLPNSIIHEVFVKSRNRLLRIPAQWYSVNPTDSITGQACTTVTMHTPPSARGDYDDEIYVTQTSPVGPLVQDVCAHLASTYLNTTLTLVAGDLTKYPVNFTYFDQRDAIQAIEEICELSRCAVYWKANALKMVYLGLKPTMTVLTDADVDERSILIDSTPTPNNLKTQIKGKYRLRYTDLDKNGNEIPREVVLSNNAELYGTFEQEYDFYIYNNLSLVEKSVNFWLQRQSLVYQQITFTTSPKYSDFESYQGIQLTLTGLNVEGVIEKVIHNSDETLTITINTSTALEGDDTNYWSA